MTTDRGYAIYEGVLAASEVDDVARAFQSVLVNRTKAGARHVLGVPTVRDLAHDRRLIALASTFVGAGAVPFRATLFDKSPAANWLVVWHQDTALPLRSRIDDGEWGPWSSKAKILYAHAPAWALEQVVALRVHLDDSTRTNGPLRVLPNTHQRGVLQDAEVERAAREITSIDCLSARGGVIAMRPLTVHASSKATDDHPRRVLHIEYASALTLAPGIDLALV